MKLEILYLIEVIFDIPICNYHHFCAYSSLSFPNFCLACRAGNSKPWGRGATRSWDFWQGSLSLITCFPSCSLTLPSTACLQAVCHPCSQWHALPSIIREEACGCISICERAWDLPKSGTHPFDQRQDELWLEKELSMDKSNPWVLGGYHDIWRYGKQSHKLGKQVNRVSKQAS